ncbi:site-specific tyrosine recombinase/integron integrase [Brevibacillus reuszeri]|uniref:site-specific tyrosine recombinase/integron integrase n=1 Tax=Brevibacillus TaxID=55080 RepID=UPI000CCC23B7|nr:site-specific tyrosine recombinase/integron integrase [Brevibacillus reuszeri]
MLLSQAIHLFDLHLSAIDRSEQTRSGYQKDLTQFHRFLEDQYNCPPYLEDVKLSDLEAYLSWLKEEKEYAPASRSRNLYTLRSFYNYCYKKELVERNIAFSLENIKLQQKERTYLTEPEVNELVQAIDHDLIRLVVTFLYYTGLRISECLNLKVDDVDLNRQMVHVRAGKGNKDRVVPLSDKIVPLLREYSEHVRPQTSDRFFATDKTGKLSPVYVNRVLAETTEKLGWKKTVTAHILRHSFASQLVKKDVNLVQIQKLLGHSSLKVTSIYTHADTDQLKDAVSVL